MWEKKRNLGCLNRIMPHNQIPNQRRLCGMKKELISSIFRILNNVEDFKELEKKVFELISRIVILILKEVLKLLDEKLRKDRDKKRYELLDTKKRTVETMFGDLEIERRYYKDHKIGSNVFLLDERLDLEPYKRKSQGVKEAALELITDSSYRKVAIRVEELTGGSLSHTSVHNFVQEIGGKIAKKDKKRSKKLFDFGMIPEGEKEVVDQLFLEADGVYISLQNEEKQRGELKLGISYNGWEKRNLGSEEYVTKNKKIHGGVFDQEQFWKEVGSQIYKDNKFENATVVLNGDGASWIDKGLEYIPEIDMRELDSYHWNKKTTTKLGNSRYKEKIREDIRNRDKESLKNHLNKAKSYQKTKKKKSQVEELKTYLLKHWEELNDYRNKISAPAKEFRGLGAMESNIDKILANRMKKKGMSWSYSGASNLAKVLIAKQNKQLKEMITTEIKSNNELNKTKNIEFNLEGDLDQLAPKQGGLPALKGPSAGESWTKFLRGIR